MRKVLINKKVAVLSNINLDLLLFHLKKHLLSDNFEFNFYKGSYNQYHQEILDENSGLSKFSPDFVILFFHIDEIIGKNLIELYSFSENERKSLVESELSQLDVIFEKFSKNFPNSVLIINSFLSMSCPSLQGVNYSDPKSSKGLIREFNVHLEEVCKKHKNITTIDLEELALQIGLYRWFDYRNWYLSRTPMSREGLIYLAEEYSITIMGLLGIQYKCIIVDLDNTLWGGVVGEDGVGNLKLGFEGVGFAYHEFQKELKRVSNKGIILAICSKNNFDDAMDVINNHSAMILRNEDFSIKKINWEPKINNISQIANELNIGVDSIVFLDDNPVEREWVRKGLPGIVVPEFPADPFELKSFFKSIEHKYFYRSTLLKEDLIKKDLYDSQILRNELLNNSSTIDDFLVSLNMNLKISNVNIDSIQRVAQLTQKTNQFNFTTRRYSVNQIQEFLNDQEFILNIVEVDDKFGPNGIVGALFAKQVENQIWMIDTFLLSCRVLGRKVEEVFLNSLIKKIKRMKGSILIGEYISTKKNIIVKDFYKNNGFYLKQQDSTHELWELKLSEYIDKNFDWCIVEEVY